MCMEICRLWALLMPREMLEFFYQNTLFLVLVTLIVFLLACRFCRGFAFSKPMLIFFGVFVGGYSLLMLFDALQYIDLLFPSEKQLVAFDITDNTSLFPLSPDEYYALDGSYYSAIEFETDNRISFSIFERLSLAVPAGIACIVYDILFIVALVRKRSGKKMKGGAAQ